MADEIDPEDKSLYDDFTIEDAINSRHGVQDQEIVEHRELVGVAERWDEFRLLIGPLPKPEVALGPIKGDG